MSNAEKYRNRLITLLKELFQLDQPELDFGLYKIMHAKSVQITHFLENDLLKEIQQAFGDKDTVDAAQLKAQAVAKLKEALGDEALDESGKLQEAYVKLPAGKKYLEDMAAVEAAKDTLNAEAEVYDHLYRFFERYYDSGDFMSRRYYARESDSRAAPYAVPYDGREVYLHWANKDQYYIKSSEYLTNYTFELNEAIRQEAERQKGQKGKGEAFDFNASVSDERLKVHFRIVDASEGEHGNIKAGNDQKRFFIIHDEEPVRLENGELVIQFQYRIDPEKTGQDNTWQQTRLQQAEAVIVESLKGDKAAVLFLQGLAVPAPTDAKDKRTLLGKYLQKYAARNTMDYFIHKDLGSFLRRELDFYIKNEIMRLDDIENAEAPKVEQYLGKIRVLRRISHQLIAFLAQLEDFQKKLWLKKKFVTETNYCITLDRIPESFYPEIAANDAQREEWVGLFAIDEIKKDLANPFEYSNPLTVEFLKANPFLLVDTVLFDEGFKEKLLAEIPSLENQCDGVLIHSENYQAIGLLQSKIRETIRFTYIDPPYNTGDDGFIYKDRYMSSSWLSMLYDRISLAKSLMARDSYFVASIDDCEVSSLYNLLDDQYGRENRVASLVWDRNRKNDAKFVSVGHEYMLVYANDKGLLKAKGTKLRELKSGVSEAQKKFKGMLKKSGGDLALLKSLWDEYLITIKDPETKSVFSKYQKFSEKGPYRDDGNINWPGGGGPRYEVLHPITKKPVKIPKSGWRYPDPNTFWEKYDNGYIAFGDDENKVPGVVYYLFETMYQVMGSVFWSYAQTTNVNFENIIGGRLFDNPKDYLDISRVVAYFSKSEDLILDYFAGSGTTGHSVISLNRDDGGKRKYILVEMGNHFDTVLKPRISKSVYSKDWGECKPISRSGVSHCFKYVRLESYEDALNNLLLKSDVNRDAALEKNPDMQRDYLLNYFLDVETQDSQSLLNIADFRDPTAYKMWIKKPGSEEQTLQNIDLIESFNWLIGLWADHIAAPQSFSAEFEREKDADLPADQNTRLVCKKLKTDAKGDYWFRLIEGYTLKVPGDKTSKVPTLIVWRKQTDDAEKDNAVLQKYLMEKLGISPREQTYDVIYVNGSHTLPNPVIEGEQIKVRLIEEAFHTAMWAGDSV